MIFTKKIQFVGVYLQPALKFKMAHRTYSNLKTQGVNKQISRAISSETILKESTDKNNKGGETSFIILNSQKRWFSIDQMSVYTKRKKSRK